MCGLHVFERGFLFWFGFNAFLCKRSLKKSYYLRNECSEVDFKLYFLVLLYRYLGKFFPEVKSKIR